MSDSLEIKKDALPVHVGIIMDGNGRWAKLQGKNRSYGHNEGLHRAKEIAKAASDLGIKNLTLYLFSTENWKRTEEEVGFLMNLIHMHLRQELQFYIDNQIRVRILGDITGLSQQIQDDIINAEKDTEHFTGMTITLAINYGGRDCIIRSVKKIIENNYKTEDINEKLIEKYMDFPELPDADLIIRTGGEKRLSNFLTWQSVYSEFIFSDTLWPEYYPEEFYKDIIEFQKRTRRFGAVL